MPEPPVLFAPPPPPELQQYYEYRLEMMSGTAWKQLIEDLTEMGVLTRTSATATKII